MALVRLADRLPGRPPAPRRGGPVLCSDRLFLRSLVVMIVRHLHRPGELQSVLDEPTAEMRQVRALLVEVGAVPSRRTGERRLAHLPDTLPAQIACLGCLLVEQLRPWATGGRAGTADSTALHARGGGRRAKHRAGGVVPHTGIDTEVG